MRSEFEFIQNVKEKHLLRFVGDDCAVLPKDEATDLLVTSDMLVENIDFCISWTTPEFLGHKALAVSLSDVAAMGGDPKFALLSIAVAEKLWKSDFLDRFYDGWHELANNHNIELVGGDVSKSPDKLVIDSTLVGEVPKGKAILRSGAQVGDAIFVTGYLGGAAAGLKILKDGKELTEKLTVPERHVILRQLQPLPQIRTGKLLQDLRLPTAMIDISDGLSSDLHHLIGASQVGAKLFADEIPVDPAITGIETVSADALKLALHGGEDFELLFTCEPEKIPAALDLGFYQIGEITPEAGIIDIVHDENVSRLQPRGFRHF